MTIVKEEPKTGIRFIDKIFFDAETNRFGIIGMLLIAVGCLGGGWCGNRRFGVYFGINNIGSIYHVCISNDISSCSNEMDTLFEFYFNPN